ncbi:MAG: hypothetical protein AAF353_01950 [Pseudomonadota bacterium]
MKARSTAAALIPVVTILLSDQPSDPPGSSNLVFNPVKVVDSSTTIPNGSGSFIDFDTPVMSDMGIAFRGEGSGDQEGIYYFSQNSISRIVDKNTSVPSGVGNFSSIRRPSIHNNEVVFYGASNSVDSGIYKGTTASVALVADENTDLPGGTTHKFERFDFFPSISGGGVVISGRTLTPNLREGIYKYSGGSGSVIADSDSSMPNGSTTMGFFRDPKISGNVVAFYGGEDSVSGGTVEGLVKYEGGVLTSVYIQGVTQVPGSGTTLSGIDDIEAQAISMFGSSIAFSTRAFGTLQEGIYTFTSGGLVLIADESTPAPDAEGNLFDLVHPCISGADILFKAISIQTQPVQTLIDGLYYYDGDAVGGSTLSKVIAEGDMLDGATVTAVDSATQGCINGAIVARITLSDGSIAIYRFDIEEE